MKSSNDLIHIGIVGAGTMGAGIAQLAAQAGHTVYIHDIRPGVAQVARERIAGTLEVLVTRGRIQAQHTQPILARIEVCHSLEALGRCGLIIEAVVENLDAKREVLGKLEELTTPNTILASCTSALSITALGRDLQYPRRLVGVHFFNPATLMRLVEVVSGLQTGPDIAQKMVDLTVSWGKKPVRVLSTPGFIVNRIARPFYSEALTLLQEGACRSEQIDIVLRGAGFRMGPCELMDLIGHDVNYSVTELLFYAHNNDRRFVPSLLQKEMVDGGLLGRKTGRGFYIYPHAAPTLEPYDAVSALDTLTKIKGPLSIHGQGRLGEWLVAHWKQRLQLVGIPYVVVGASDWTGLAWGDGSQLLLSDGRAAQQLAALAKHPNRAVFDLPLRLEDQMPLMFSYAQTANDEWAKEVEALLALAGWHPIKMADSVGLVVARTIAMLINEAAEAVWLGVCNTDDANAAMKFGTNYPAGPFEWLENCGPEYIQSLLENIYQHYRSDHYRISPWLHHYFWQEALA